MRNLLSLFCPLTASAAAAAADVSHPLALSLANVGLPKIMPALAVEDQVKLLPYPQEVGPSMANVGPLNTNPAFAKEHQVKYMSAPIYLQDPYITRMPHFHVPPIMEPHLLVSQVQDESKHQPRSSTAFVDEQNAGDAVEIDAFEDTHVLFLFFLLSPFKTLPCCNNKSMLSFIGIIVAIKSIRG